MKQQGVLHRDIKGSNLLIDNEGNLKIADFGLACFYDSNLRQQKTSRIVTLWYPPPELLLGATHYGICVDLWSSGCILAELLAERPVMPERTEVEQLHKIFKLCGSPSDEYWKKHKLPNASLFKPQQPYKRCITEVYKDFPPSSLPLVCTLLSLEPEDQGTTTSALCSDFTQISSQQRNGCKIKRRRSKKGGGKSNPGGRKVRHRDRTGRSIPAPETNAELQSNLDKWRVGSPENSKSKSEKFPPPHQDGSVGFLIGKSQNGPISFGPGDTSFILSIFSSKSPLPSRSNANQTSRRRLVQNDALS